MEAFLQDVRYGMRMLWKSPAFTLASLTTLALCVAANTAMFTLVNALLLRPLPYPNAERMVWVSEYVPSLHTELALGPDYVVWRDNARSFDQVAAYDSEDFNLSGVGDPVRVEAGEVTSTFFPLFDTRPVVGRSFSAAEDRPGAEGVAILTSGFAESHFGGAANSMGKSVSLNGGLYTVVGVMGADFRFPDNEMKPEILLPLPLSPYNSADKSFRSVSVVGRLAPNCNPQHAAAELDLLNQGRHASDKEDSGLAGMRAQIQPLQTHVVGDTRRPLLVLMVTVVLVMLIGCVNVANLQLARAIGRKRELAVRMALGATRRRLVRQLLTESLVLAAGGGVAGFLLASWAVDILRTAHIESLPHLSEVRVDGYVFGFTLLLIVVTSLLFGFSPSILHTRQDVGDGLSTAGPRTTSNLHQRHLSGALVVSELALALMLLAGAGLLIRTFVGLLRTDPGFNSERLLTAKISLSDSKYVNSLQKRQFFEELLLRLQALHGVTDAAVGSSLPLTGHAMHGAVRAEGQPEIPPPYAAKVFFDCASPDYFRTLGIRLLQGRAFAPSDSGRDKPPVILNETAARKFFPGQNAVGKHVKMAMAKDWLEVVGVVDSVLDNGLDGEASPEFYVPLGYFPTPSRIAIRTTGDPKAVAAELRREVQAVDKDQPVFDVMPMEARIADSLQARKFNMSLLVMFAALALLLAGVGIYGVMSYMVVQRTHEIGIRLALGADRRRVLRLIVSNGLSLVAIGTILGLTGFIALSRFMSAMIHGIAATDTITLVAGTALMASVALLASYIPARRAAKLDPVIALRCE
jgi:putative ABC transport system permease protein